MYSVSFTDHREKYCLSFHYNGANSYLFVNGTEIIKLRAKDSEIVATPLCLGNIAKDWSLDNTNDTGLNKYIYDFSVDYDTIAVDDILDIHKYLMEKSDMKMFGFIKKVFFTGLRILSSVNLLTIAPLRCISMTNQE